MYLGIEGPTGKIGNRIHKKNNIATMFFTQKLIRLRKSLFAISHNPLTRKMNYHYWFFVFLQIKP